MKILALVLSIVLANAANAAEYKCHSSKFPKDLQHAFADGYTTLSIENGKATLKYFYVNTVARRTDQEYEGHYAVGGLKGGKGKMSGLHVATLTSSLPAAGLGDGITPLYIEPSLLVENPRRSGIVGQYAFAGHGYSWDWNVCYAN